MLIFPLKKEWYEKIKSGEKTIEYREVKPYWVKRIEKITKGKYHHRDYGLYHGCCADNAICKMRLGYTKKHLLAHIDSIRILNTGKDTDLHIDKPVYAIHLANVVEII